MDNFSYRLFRKIALIRMRFFLDLRPSSSPYISGDTFRAFADHVHDESSTLDPHSVKRDQIVFVKSDLLDTFFLETHPEIPYPYVLITHNSDRNITEQDTSHMNDKIIHWFAQNLLITHPKMTPLPIGLENAHYHMHGVTKIFDELRISEVEKMSRILFGFNISTNIKERRPAYDALSALSIADSIVGRIIPKKYLELLNKYGFVASPPGNGTDCHRTWEALYLGAIPIVKRSAGMEYFRSLGLPIWIIDDWSELNEYTEELLGDKYRSMKNHAEIRPLDFDFWKRMIEQSTQ